MARRRGNTMSSRMADSAKQTGGRLLADWAALTWRADSAKLGPVNLSVINWVLFAICLVGLWFLPGMRKIFLIALAVGFIFTLGRSAAIMPKRRKALQAIYDQNQRTAGLPRGSARNPADPKDRIQVRRWGKNAAPQEVVLTIGDCPAAISVYSHHLVERSLEASMGPLGEGQQWIFEWPDRTRVHVYPDSAENPAALRQAYNTKVRTSTKNLLGIRERDAADYHFECSEWSSEETKRGTMLEIPGRITIDYGEFDDTNPTNREKVERTLDKQLKSPGEWIFNWDDGVLELNQVDRSSTEAKQKRTLRKISDDVIGLTRSNGRNGDTPQVTVNKWMAEKHLVKLLGREDVPSNYPQHITINFGTRDLADRKKRSFFENGFDTAMGATYPQVTWLYNWEMESGCTVLYTTCVATSSKRALRKNTEARFRNVVESKFGSSRNFVDCDMLEWQDEPGPSGEQLPQTARVRFGEYDVTKRDTQEAFEQHWDSLTDACDWNYKWSPAEGIVTMTAVPALPEKVLFPEVGTEDFDWIINKAREGKIIFGPQKGGGWLTLDMNSVPHALVGGATNAGKSVTLTVLLFLAMYNVDLFELYVCDPKRTDFTWTPEFPNVIQFGATDTEIVAAVAAAREEMNRRQSLLARVGVRNLRELRAKFAADPDLVKQHGPAPRRLILFFDELAEFLAKSSNKEIEELKDEARTDLEYIGRMGRAMEVNIISAAQKPDGKIISTQLREQLVFRLCVGPVNSPTSIQIVHDNHGTRFPDGSPKGRAWAWDSKDGYRMAQTFFIPDETGPLPWDDTAQVTGSKDMVRQHLEDLGYARTQITNRDGGTEPRWVPVESEEMNDSFDDNTPAPEQSDPIEDQGEDAQPDNETTSAPVVEEESAPEEPALPTMDEPEEEPEEQSPVAEESSPVDTAMNAATTPKQSPTRRSTQRKVTAFMDDDDSAQPF